MGLWERQADYPGSVGLYGFGVVDDTRVYVGMPDWYRSLWMYKGDPLASQYDTWNQKPNIIASGRSGPVCFLQDNHIYFGLGKYGQTYLVDMWKYNITTQVWSQMADFPYGPRFGAMSFALGGMCYVVGGATSLNPRTISPDVYVFNPNNQSWSYLHRFPFTPVMLGASFKIDTLAYVCCGADSASSLSNKLYSFNGSTWTQKASFPDVGRWQLFAGNINSTKAIVGLGQIFSSLAVSAYPDNLYVYDKTANTWSDPIVFPGSGRYSSVGGGTTNGRVYIGLGYDGREYKKDWYLYRHGQLTDISLDRTTKWNTLNVFSEKNLTPAWKVTGYTDTKSQEVSWLTKLSASIELPVVWKTSNNISVVASRHTGWICGNNPVWKEAEEHWGVGAFTSIYSSVGLDWYTVVAGDIDKSESLSWNTTGGPSLAQHFVWTVGVEDSRVDRSAHVGVSWKVASDVELSEATTWTVNSFVSNEAFIMWRSFGFIASVNLSVGWSTVTAGAIKYKFESVGRVVDVDAKQDYL